MQTCPLRVLLAEDVHMVRGALVALLELQPDIQVVAQVERGDAILPAALTHRPDVAIIDVNLPGIDGLSAAMLVHDQLPSCRTLILTGIDRPGMLRRSLEAGVTGLMLKHAPPASLAEAVREVAAGRRVVDSQIALAALNERSTSPLSPREIEILKLTANGHSAKEIAAMLYLSAGTVRNHLTSIATKLDARTRVDAVRIARDAGWIL
ncbi:MULTISPECIES: response regulator [Micromonosporaceae]|uniref:response regulator transcription factor n=1 Tax=Micromonosporaceae TaxID=28056 RepID=UPI000F495AF5|nr:MULTISPECIES: response regulator transcription factor [Micromonosporaceae]MDG4772646.1 response regulator transcription factor [Solwaraspora sp. WMMD792]ROO62096.1 LuxR family two component transcriptional regulator [Micromonospora sp. Llam0]